jgi:UDP-glucose 4-epimerase
MKTYLITGVNGYIGKNLAFSLVQTGNIVVGLGRLDVPNINFEDKRFIYIKIDLVNEEFVNHLNKYEFNGVFHLASQQPNSKDLTYDDFYISNVQTTINILKYFNNKSLDFLLYSSTISIFGNNDNNTIDENTIPNPTNYYGLTKYIAESIIKIESNNFSSKLIVLRLQSVFGKNDGYGIVHTFYESMINNKDIDIFSKGEISRNLILIDDVINVLIAFARDFSIIDKYEVFNLASNNSMKTVEIASLIKSYLNSNSVINCVDKKYMFDWDVFVSNKKLVNKLNLTLSSMEEAILSYLIQKNEL